MNNFMVIELETVVLNRNPLLAKKLQNGLTEAKIERILAKAGVKGNTEPIFSLYSWKNGTFLDFELTKAKNGFFPGEVYHFVELDRAIMNLGFFRHVAANRPQLLEAVGRYFPIFWNGSHRHIAVDLEPLAKGRVILVDHRAEKPFKMGYPSFEGFISDMIRANKENVPLTCFAEGRADNKSWASIRTSQTDQQPQSRVDEPSMGASASKLEANGNSIPKSENTVALRTDFSDEAAWKSLCVAIQKPDEGFVANVDFLSDPKFNGLTADKLPSLLPEDSSLTFAFIIDHVALSAPDHPILVVDLQDNPGRAFRVILSELGSVENNLSVANMGFDEFARAVDEEGVFRGF